MRALYSAYTGPLYQVCKGVFTQGKDSCTSGVTKDIGVVAGGYADSAAQDAFCAGAAVCTISIIYDQSPNRNDLKPSPANPGAHKPSADNPAFASDLKITLSGHTVYGILVNPYDSRVPTGKQGVGYRSGCANCATLTATATATGDQPETEYMVTGEHGSPTAPHLIDGCCFDYGNAETTGVDNNAGTMEAVYFGGGVAWGTGSPGMPRTNGPWVMADLENGIFAGWDQTMKTDQAISTNTALKLPFVTALIVGDTADKNGGAGRFAVYGGDATSGPLKTMYDGIRPTKDIGYLHPKKQGSIILGTGGDNSDLGGGEWYEGVMASGAATMVTLNALQANIVAAGYGK